jgi:hypothetical protein
MQKKRIKFATMQALAVKVLLCIVCTLTLLRGAAASDPADYLPLIVGQKWTLRSPAVSTPVVLEVLSRHDDQFEVKFDNPWVNSVMTFQPQAGKYILTALTMGGQSVPASNDVYYDFTVHDGQKWKNHIGTLTLISRSKTVRTRTRTYTNCVEIQEINSQGNKLYWFFAPGVGYVQFGDGPQAFVLDEASSGKSPAETPISVVQPPPLTAKRGVGSDRTWIALAANPAPDEGYTPQTVKRRFEQSLSAGVTYVYLSPKWNELEPRPGKYEFKDLDFLIGEAVSAGLPLVCNLRVIDTNQRAIPSDLMSKSFRDPKVRDRITNLLRAMLPRMHGKLRYMLIGNEVDGYFKAHQGEIGEYRDFFALGASVVKATVPGTPVSLSVTFDGLSIADNLLKPLLEQTDFLALTYYPLRPDFTVRDATDVPSDFGRMIQVAHGRKILLQEVGYPSSPINGSSEDKQAAMFAAVFRQLQEHLQDFIGANFLFMSNLSDSVVDTLAKYYSLPNGERFKAYLKTLGMLDDGGHPKKSWDVFQQQAQLLRK